MKVVTYSHARNALKSVLENVLQDSKGDAMLMFLDYYNSIMETLYLLSTPTNAAALARAIQQDKAG